MRFLLNLLSSNTQPGHVFYAPRNSTIVLVCPVLSERLFGWYDESARTVLSPSKNVPSCASIVVGEGDCFEFSLDLTGTFRFATDSGCVSGCIVVLPQLKLRGVEVPLEALCVKTLLTRCLGPLDSWDAVFSQLRGYNAVHFTPMQELEGSAYSIRDHTRLASGISWEDLKKTLDHIRQDFGLLSFTDLVWNHVSVKNEFLLQHPEIGYSVSLLHPEKSNCPHLAPALELDLALQAMQGEVKSEEDINFVLSRVTNEVWNNLKLWEYFILDVETAVKNFVPGNKNEHFASLDEATKRLAEQYVKVLRPGKRFGKEVSSEASAMYDNVDAFRVCVETYNLHRYRELDDYKQAVITNLGHRLRYLFLESKEGRPKSLFEAYFAEVQPGVYCACNGWTMDSKAMSNDVIYLRRDLLVWSDLARLRYGSSPGECPQLWKFMEDYTKRTAELFDGVRIDNAHTTPLHVAKYLLKVARSVNPDLFVVAELFTASDEWNAEYVRETAAQTLVVEAMKAWDPHELSRLLHRFGGNPVGSVQLDYPQVPLKARLPPSMFMDCSHDNRTPAELRHVADTLSNGACVWSTHTAVGSTWGLDELVPYNISVASENRPYPRVSPGGIVEAKADLGAVHQDLACRGFSEIHVHRQGDVIIVQRHHPELHESAFFVCRTAFSEASSQMSLSEHDRSFQIAAGEVKFRSGYFLRGDEEELSKFQNDPKTINGLQSWKLCHSEEGSFVVESVGENQFTIRLSHSFPIGGILRFESKPPQSHVAGLKELQEKILPRCAEALEGTSLIDLNVIMYRSGPEEHATVGSGPYEFPGYGSSTFCGIAGIFSVFQSIQGDLSSPVYGNLRQGDWLMRYCWERLEKHKEIAPKVEKFAAWLNAAGVACSKLLRHLVPKYFTQVICVAMNACRQRCAALMSKTVDRGFLHRLALGSVQMFGPVPNADIKSEISGQKWKGIRSTLSAGLPHFSTGYMRAWGRDTCIALRGLLILPGRLEEARDLLRIFGACVRNGLVPNLLDGASRPRYNARDACWWWLQAFQDLYHADRDGTVGLLKKPVPRLFAPRSGALSSTLMEIAMEIMQSHASGIQFRDDGLDSEMVSEGFNLGIGLDVRTGFIYGGNDHNCGTWMDKNGSSERAGNRGTPATPRDGCAVELAGLIRSALRWMDKLHQEGVLQNAGVSLVSARKNFLSWKEWAALMDDNFEKLFYVPQNKAEDHQYDIDERFVHRRGIYKDSHRSTRLYTDYQLRPNFCIAMVVAPELFNRKHAAEAVSFAWDVLKGPMGVKTLDPKDWQYRGNYDNKSDSSDFYTSRGYNYHQGPEWLWIVGFVLRARLAFSDDKRATAIDIRKYLGTHERFLASSPWQGLPELQNEGGALCPDSCPTQAWSMGCILEVEVDVQHVLNTK